MSLLDVIGLVGVALIAAAYLLLQTERWHARTPWYSVANALGAALILITLTVDFNLSAALIEGFWLIVSLYGVWSSLRGRRDPNPESPRVD